MSRQKSAPKPQPKSKPSSLRIIGGKWRGRKIPFIEVEGLRPTPDRVRETLFNWLSPSITDAQVLDLFAGSGALSFEALSRGAAAATQIEVSSIAYKQLKAAKQALQADHCHIINKNAEAWLKQGFSLPEYDLVFLDPPFANDGLPDLFAQLEQSGCLKESSLIYVETGSALAQETVPATWMPLRQKKAGQVFYYLFRRTTNGNTD
ncbi:MAG: 16S rRNA (guanine(966)-N(2))-methyltransferase RsmD [Gammaproteobacteria bacterium]|nr:16S rRNA (guanine(966)-N(2))-methyltransferase RsmD [Gammaproteobacteria bacterium]